MLDQYFGVKELYEAVLRAKVPMQFGTRYIEEGEPVLYFEKVTMAVLNEKSSPVMARGGWSNLPRVIWEDRSEVKFTLSEGVLSQVSLGILLSAVTTSPEQDKPLLVQKKEGPFTLTGTHRIYLQHWPTNKKKVFILEVDRKAVQKKIYGKYVDVNDPFDNTKKLPCIELYKDKECKEYADIGAQYVVDYYYEYGDEALIYSIEKERFNGLFTLEGKFYSKDETEGINYTNLLYMPKVRIVSDINLRLGERADPTMSVFNIIGLPENVGGGKESLVLEITHLNSNIDEE